MQCFFSYSDCFCKVKTNTKIKIIFYRVLKDNNEDINTRTDSHIYLKQLFSKKISLKNSKCYICCK
ncbi:MAG: hypothetical protein A2236_08395 [Bacteroidetes bacterium RIFOXYA2_FULL_33_7]|nr:MAG: hypothetical protein A2236_08395 [Bacteroidetes bacterium RIFOXYA2_FULL_33_7]